MSKKAFELHQHVDCPYCGRLGVVANVYVGPEYFIVHKTELSRVQSVATGRWIEAKIVTDSCWRGRELRRKEATTSDLDFDTPTPAEVASDIQTTDLDF